MFSKLLGFFREITLSYFYGASSFSDVYLIAVSIPNVLFDFLAIAISTTFIPIYNELSLEKSEKEANRFTNNLTSMIILLCTLIVIVFFLFTKEILGIFAKGFTGETLQLAINFTRVSIFGIYATLLFHLYSSFLRIKNDYVTPAVSWLSLNIIVISFMIISAKADSRLLIWGWGTTLAFFSQLILVLFASYKKGYRYKPFLNFKDKNISNLFLLSIPMILGGSINGLNILIDRTIASGVAEGGISALNYAVRLICFVQGIFVLNIVTIMFPEISKMAVNKDFNSMKKTVSESLILVLLSVIPSTFGLMIFSSEIVYLLFGRGAFDNNALTMTSSALFYYSLGISGTAITEILVRVFYSVKDTVTPVWNALVAVVVNIVLNIILSKYMGVGGLALATSIAGTIGMSLMFYSFRKNFGSFDFLTIFKETIKILAASLLMAIAAKFAYGLLLNKFTANISLIFAIIIAIIIYSILVVLFKVKEVDSIINGIKRRLSQITSNA